ncbi:Dps family protein [Bacillus seohaeanensis]|uniref:Dps family protein n=1 Tax=Bacillus seohaeanensis TaxID=284580 RepID=A0ABW5RP78_9BACI
MAQQLNVKLNKQLANWNVLYTKLHNYHWYVKGNDFFVLHEKFEEYYGEAAGYIDEIAERLLSIGGQPIATMKEYLESASIEEANGVEQARNMVQNLTEDFKTVIKESKEVIELAEDDNDQPTADLFIGIRASLEKHVWMLSAYIA